MEPPPEPVKLAWKQVNEKMNRLHTSQVQIDFNTVMILSQSPGPSFVISDRAPLLKPMQLPIHQHRNSRRRQRLKNENNS
jgi:hypothetical protein